MSPQTRFPSFPAAEQGHFEAALVEACRRVVRSGSYVLDGEVAAFEREFGAFLGGAQVVGVGSGTDAIELILRALNVGGGQQVVVPALAPSAVAAAVARSGAEPVFADVEPETLTLSPDSLEELLGSGAYPRVRAVLAIHLYGHPVNWEALFDVARRHGVMLLEDGAQAHGAEWRGRMVGTLGVAAAFSFYPTKNLAALGDAGAVVTRDVELAERVRLIREYGWRPRFVSACGGINSRLDELQAAILRVKLPGLRDAVAARRGVAARYGRELREEKRVSLPVVREDCQHAFHQYVLRTPRRDSLMAQLREQGIPVAVHYPVPLHRQPAYFSAVDLPESEKAVKEVLSLPMHPYLPGGAVEEVCRAIVGGVDAGR